MLLCTGQTFPCISKTVDPEDANLVPREIPISFRIFLGQGFVADLRFDTDWVAREAIRTRGLLAGPRGVEGLHEIGSVNAPIGTLHKWCCGDRIPGVAVVARDSSRWYCREIALLCKRALDAQGNLQVYKAFVLSLSLARHADL